MAYTTISTGKGQITIPAQIRKKYKIDAETPLVIEDTGKGTITIKVMHLIDHDAITFYENEKEIGLTFKNGIDPEVLIRAIRKIDG